MLKLTFLLISYDKRREPLAVKIGDEGHSLSPTGLSNGREPRLVRQKN